jgi:hypothetical protein
MTARRDFRRRGKNVVVVCTKPRKLVSCISRILATSIAVALWALPSLKIAVKLISHWLIALVITCNTGIVDQDVQVTLGFLDMFFCGDDRLDVSHVEAEKLDIKILVF